MHHPSYIWGEKDLIFDGRYEILEVMRGSMAVVYVVRDLTPEHSGRPEHMVAKTLRPGLATIPALRRRFIEEAKLWLGISPNDNILRAYFCDYFLDLPYIFADHIKPHSLPNTLAGWIARRITPPPVATYLTAQILSGLEAAYQSNVVAHGDLKPSNILIDQYGCLKIADWGLSRLGEDTIARIEAVASGRNSDAEIEDSLLYRGTPGYAPPELERGYTEAGEATDLFSVGVLLGEMLTRSRLAAGTSIAHIAQAIEATFPLRDDERLALASAIAGLLQHDADARLAHRHDHVKTLKDICTRLTGLTFNAPAITIAPIDQSWAGQLAVSRMRLGDHGAGLKWFNKMSRQTRESPNESDDEQIVVWNIDDGTVAMSKAVIDELEREHAENPGDPDKLFALAGSLALAGVLDRSRELYERALESDPQSEQALQGLIQLAQRQGKHEAAVAYGQRLARIDPPEASRWMAYAEICSDLERIDDGMAACRTAEEIGEITADELMTYGHLTLRVGDPAKAAEIFSRAINADEKHGLAWYNLGVCQYELGNRAESKASMLKAIKHNGQPGQAQNRLAAMSMDDGDFEAAETYLQEAMRHSSNNPKIWFNLGQCMLATGRPTEALRYYDVALSIKPDYELARTARQELTRTGESASKT